MDAQCQVVLATCVIMAVAKELDVMGEAIDVQAVGDANACGRIQLSDAWIASDLPRADLISEGERLLVQTQDAFRQKFLMLTE